MPLSKNQWSGTGGGYFNTKPSAMKSALRYGREMQKDLVQVFSTKPGARPITLDVVTGKRITKAESKRNARRSNPSVSFEEAEQLSREFHGREPDEIEEHTEVEEYDKNLAKLGDLEELTIISNDGSTVTPIDYENCGVRLAAKGNQLQFVGGDQEINLDELVSEIPELQNQVEVQGKTLLDIGEVFSIVYFTDKHHLAGAKSQRNGSSYEHQFGEEGGTRPRLQYDCRNAGIKLIGGSYKIKPEGIWD